MRAGRTFPGAIGFVRPTASVHRRRRRMRRTETQEGPRRYPYTIEWTGSYHGISVEIRIRVVARRQFEWFADIEGVPPRPQRSTELENFDTTEVGVLRTVLRRVELIYQIKPARSAITIGRSQPQPVDRLALYKLNLARRAAREAAERERVAKVQPSLPGLG